MGISESCDGGHMLLGSDRPSVHFDERDWDGGYDAEDVFRDDRGRGDCQRVGNGSGTEPIGPSQNGKAQGRPSRLDFTDGALPAAGLALLRPEVPKGCRATGADGDDRSNLRGVAAGSRLFRSRVERFGRTRRLFLAGSPELRTPQATPSRRFAPASLFSG